VSGGSRLSLAAGAGARGGRESGWHKIRVQNLASVPRQPLQPHAPRDAGPAVPPLHIPRDTGPPAQAPPPDGRERLRGPPPVGNRGSLTARVSSRRGSYMSGGGGHTDPAAAAAAAVAHGGAHTARESRPGPESALERELDALAGGPAAAAPSVAGGGARGAARGHSSPAAAQSPRSASPLGGLAASRSIPLSALTSQARGPTGAPGPAGAAAPSERPFSLARFGIGPGLPGAAAARPAPAPRGPSDRPAAAAAGSPPAISPRRPGRTGDGTAAPTGRVWFPKVGPAATAATAAAAAAAATAAAPAARPGGAGVTGGGGGADGEPAEQARLWEWDWHSRWRRRLFTLAEGGALRSLDLDRPRAREAAAGAVTECAQLQTLRAPFEGRRNCLSFELEPDPPTDGPGGGGPGVGGGGGGGGEAVPRLMIVSADTEEEMQRWRRAVAAAAERGRGRRLAAEGERLVVSAARRQGRAILERVARIEMGT
jgi:hypothetical protein